jgi:hypothetical protein
MRPATYYYLAQAWRPDGHRQTQRGTRSRAASRGRHAYAPRHDHPGRELPAIARRVLAVLSGTSQPAQ